MSGKGGGGTQNNGTGKRKARFTMGALMKQIQGAVEQVSPVGKSEVLDELYKQDIPKEFAEEPVNPENVSLLCKWESDKLFKHTGPMSPADRLALWFTPIRPVIAHGLVQSQAVRAEGHFAPNGYSLSRTLSMHSNFDIIVDSFPSVKPPAPGL